MACFLVPAGEAVVTTIVQKVQDKKAREAGEERIKNNGIKWSQRLGWLNKLLWGGCFLLCLEHIWHGEIVPWPPFLTAMDNSTDTSAMLHEIYTFGLPMAISLTAVWGIMVAFVELKNRAMENLPEEKVHTVEGGA